MCDVDSGIIAETKKKFYHLEASREFADFRVMLDKMEKDVDTVVISKPVHTHPPHHGGHAPREARLHPEAAHPRHPLGSDPGQGGGEIRMNRRYRYNETCGYDAVASTGPDVQP